MQNYFVFFQIPQCFSIDLIALKKAYYAVQNQIHPDKFIQTTDIEKYIAIQKTIRANTAYQILKNPSKRAMHLCELNGVNLQNSSTTMPPDFLIQQLNWHETLNQAKISQNFLALEHLKSELHAIRTNNINQIEALLNEKKFSETLKKIQQLTFLEKLLNEIDTTLYDD